MSTTSKPRPMLTIPPAIVKSVHRAADLLEVDPQYLLEWYIGYLRPNGGFWESTSGELRMWAEQMQYRSEEKRQRVLVRVERWERAARRRDLKAEAKGFAEAAAA